MPLLVTCACGRKFQAKDEYRGKQAKCPQCGQILVIDGVPIAAQPAQNVAASQPQEQVEAVDPADAVVALRAADAIRDKEMQAEADRQFLKKMLIGGGVGVVLLAIGISAFMPSKPKTEPTKTAEAETKKTPPTETKKVEPPAQPTPPVAQTNPEPPKEPAQQTPVKPQPPAFDKSVLGQNDPKRVKFSGPVVSGMTEDGAMIVQLNTETLQSGSTSTYRAKLKMRQAIAQPLPKGVGVTFEATTTPGMTQTTDFHQNDDGTRRVDAIYTATFVDAVILSTDDAVEVATTPKQTPEKTTEPVATKTEPAPNEIVRPKRAINDGPPKDDVDRYVMSAIMSKDGHARVNAMMFNPDDPRLNYEFVDRKLPLKALELMHAKLEVLEKPEDLETGPQLTDATDQVEARILMDEQVIGSGIWLDGRAAKEKFLVFLDPCKLSMPDVIKRYGPPGKTTQSGQSLISFYGRIAIISLSGKVHAVARRVTK